MQVLASSLVLDFDLYPRQTLDPFNLAHLREALKAGAVFPPVVAEEGTNRLVDGFHRVSTVLKVRGEDAVIEVEFRRYETPGKLFEEAMLLNSGHGRGLTNNDRLRCALMAREMGISDAQTAKALSITPERLEALVFERTATGPNGELQPLKWTSVPALARRPITAEQILGNKAAGGMPVEHYTAQLLNALENGLVPWDDARVVRRLSVLLERLGTALAERGLEQAS